ncbi:MAG: lytic transglycosylase domain-containing protein [Rhizobiaceae bacterium]|nr:MAG: lytic transglycosylase domain-containing protein [Rhizobiaceae bacterium]
MREGITGVAFIVLATIASAHAQGSSAKYDRLTTVDASGRVLPVDPSRAGAGTASTLTVATPCAAATKMAPQKARVLVARIAGAENFDIDFALSVARNESHFDSIALSGKGAYGLMQLLPETASRFNVDLCDPADNVRGGIRYLRFLEQQYRNPLFILAAYNAGEEAVDRNHGVPPYPETVRFVAQVMNDFYGWPKPEPEAPDAAPGRVNVHPDIIEPDRTRANPQSVSASSQARVRWQDGFVMQVN